MRIEGRRLSALGEYLLLRGRAGLSVFVGGRTDCYLFW